MSSGKRVVLCSSEVILSYVYISYCSQDGVIKIWDKDKTLLREILMSETLTVASFLNIQGSSFSFV